MNAERLAPGTLAVVEEQHEAGYSTRHVTVCEAHRGPEAYWFIQNGYNGLEVVIPFDRVAFDRSDDGTIRTIKFFRTDPRRPPMKVGSVEGGRADWGDDVIDALAQVNEEGA